jgi:glutamine synthetase
MKIAAEYIWLNETGDVCSLTKTLFIEPKDKDDNKMNIVNELLNINIYEDLSLQNSILKPVSVRLDPFRKGTNVLVVCDDKHNESDKDTIRETLQKKLLDMKEDEPKFTCNFNFAMIDTKIDTRLHGMAPLDRPPPLGELCDHKKYLVHTSISRKFPEQAYHLGLEGGLSLIGFNSGNTVNEWSVTIGEHINIQLVDDIIFFKFILIRISEMNQCRLSFGDTSNKIKCEFRYNIGKMRNENIDCTKIAVDIIKDRSLVYKHTLDNKLVFYDNDGLSCDNPYSTLFEFLNK